MPSEPLALARQLAVDDVANGAARPDQLDALAALYLSWLTEPLEWLNRAARAEHN